MMPGMTFIKRWLRCTGLTLVLSALTTPLWADENPIGRSRAAAIAQSIFGGKVLSVDEEKVSIVDEAKVSGADDQGDPVYTEPPAPETTTDSIPSPVEDVRYVVKLLQQGGRIKVIKLDATGKIL